MTAPAAAPTRRAVLRTITAVVAPATSALLAGCGSNPPAPVPPVESVAPRATPTPQSPPDGVASGTVVMVIRHGEKPDDETTTGVDANGNEDENSMTAVGWDRAHRLVGLFDPATGPHRPGLVRPAAIYAAGPNDNGYGKRTRETVTPLADRLGLPVNTSFGKGDEEELVEHVLTGPGPTLISWQHSEIPAIADAFGSVTPTPPSEWPDDRFDVVWTFTKIADGWRFTQLPELLLPQDEASVIEN
jgi:hypothetical protein